MLVLGRGLGEEREAVRGGGVIGCDYGVGVVGENDSSVVV